jgi:hypothetical protein
MHVDPRGQRRANVGAPPERAMKEERAARIEVFDEIEWRLNAAKLAEMEAICSLRVAG